MNIIYRTISESVKNVFQYFPVIAITGPRQVGERDVHQLINIKNHSQFYKFIRLCAGRVGSECNASALSNETGVSAPTINEWLGILEASYIIFKLPPYFENIGKRLIKSPKIYFYDTGLLCFLLGIENFKQLDTHPLRAICCNL